MNTKDAATIVAYAELAERAPRWYCGLDNRNGRIPVICDASADVAFLVESFHFVSDSRAELIEWMTQATARERFAVLLDDYKAAEAAGDFDEALAAADRIVKAAEVWAIAPALCVFSGPVLDAMKEEINVGSIDGDD